MAPQKYGASTVSLYATTEPWAALILETTAPFSGQAVLNLLIRGSGKRWPPKHSMWVGGKLLTATHPALHSDYTQG
jgi:hypothetical protein